MIKLSTIVAIVLATTSLFATNSENVIKTHFFETNNGLIPNYIEFAPEKGISINDLNSFFNTYWEEGSEFSFRLKSTFKDQQGYIHYKYVQTFQGIDIELAELVAHVKDDRVTSISSKLVDKAIINESNFTNEKVALKSALDFIGADIYKWEVESEEKFLRDFEGDLSATYYPKGELSYMSPDLDLDPQSLRLCYKFNIYAHQPMGRAEIYVDASNGEIIFRNELIHTANVQGSAVTAYSGTQTINTDSVGPNLFRLRQTVSGNGVNTYNLNLTTNYGLATDFNDSDNVWNNVNIAKDQYATDAHFGAEMTYDYFFTNFARNSIDNNGFALNSYIHSANPQNNSPNYVNAFWNGQVMTYGDGNTTVNPLVSLDIAGHEIAHGLTTFTANLIYNRESGALNESFSDIFGASVEHYARPNNTNWTLGEDIGLIIRNMANPNAYGDPDTYGGTNWINQVGCNPTGANDLCGVHINSGVQNFWFYLLVTGGIGINDLNDTYNVSSIGRAKAEAIAYRNLTVYLGRSSDFNEARFYSIQSAIDLYGACSPEMIAVQNAWQAVGVGNAYVPGVIADFNVSDTSSCSVPFSVSFENVSNNGFNYFWDFGDNTTDSSENPVHTYTSSGSFNVKLIADGGVCGIDSLTKSSYINIVRPNGPAVINNTICVNQPTTLTANGSGLINWYEQANGGTPVDTGNTIRFTQPNGDSTLWVEDAIIAPTQNVGAPNNTIGSGRYFSGTQSLVFDAIDAFILKEVTVYVQSLGSREVIVRDNQNNIIHSKIFNLFSGQRTLQLDFMIPVGTDYEITARSLGSNGPDLYRNNSGTSYPYVIPGLVSIKNSTASNPTGFYYYFYDWKVKRSDCVSPRVPITSFKDTTCTLTSIDELTLLNELKIYPNPAREVLNVSIPSFEGNVEISILDINGRLVKEVYNSSTSNEVLNLNINTESLNSGLYFLNIRSKEVLITKRFVITE